VTRDDKIWTKTARDDKESHYTGRDVTKRVTLGDIWKKKLRAEIQTF